MATILQDSVSLQQVLAVIEEDEQLTAREIAERVMAFDFELDPGLVTSICARKLTTLADDGEIDRHFGKVTRYSRRDNQRAIDKPPRLRSEVDFLEELEQCDDLRPSDLKPINHHGPRSTVRLFRDQLLGLADKVIQLEKKQISEVDLVKALEKLQGVDDALAKVTPAMTQNRKIAAIGVTVAGVRNEQGKAHDILTETVRICTLLVHQVFEVLAQEPGKKKVASAAGKMSGELSSLETWLAEHVPNETRSLAQELWTGVKQQIRYSRKAGKVVDTIRISTVQLKVLKELGVVDKGPPRSICGLKVEINTTTDFPVVFAKRVKGDKSWFGDAAHATGGGWTNEGEGD